MKKKNQFITNQVQVKQFFQKGGCGDEKKQKKKQNIDGTTAAEYLWNKAADQDLSYFGRVTIHTVPNNSYRFWAYLLYKWSS